MGLYGSPDLSQKKPKQPDKAKRIILTTQLATLIILYLIMFWVAEDKTEMTISYVGVMSVVYFIVYFIKMIIKLFKKESVNKEVIKILICTAIIAVCLSLS